MNGNEYKKNVKGEHPSRLCAIFCTWSSCQLFRKTHLCAPFTSDNELFQEIINFDADDTVMNW